MKKRFISIRLAVLRALVGSFMLLALLAFALPQAAQAATSGGAIIYNTVKVTYLSGTNALFASAHVSVTVNTLAAVPTVTNPTGVTTVAGALVTYNFRVKSNSNGSDTYTTSALVDTPTGISAATGPSVTANVTLWGGIALGSGAGTITIPNGTQTGLTAGTSTVQIGANTYTVTTITPGTAASTDGSGNLVAEVSTTLALTPIGASPAITAGSVTSGTQVGEFKTNALVVTFTTGTPTVVGTDGTYATHFTITTTSALPSGTLNMTTNPDVITIVSSPSVTITKIADKANASTGDTVTYTITVTNTHATASVNNVTVIDPLPQYTNYVANSTRLNAITVAGDGATSPLIAGLLVDSNGSRVPAALATGIMPAGGVATIIFKVTVQ
jgi:uncharacterized repeat protein (TIGR01451 family)